MVFDILGLNPNYALEQIEISADGLDIKIHASPLVLRVAFGNRGQIYVPSCLSLKATHSIA
jgi:hypothetical protein